MTKLNWDDLLVQGFDDQTAKHWLEPWTGFIEGRIAPVFLNRFGCWFFNRPEGHVEFFNVLTGQIETVADSYEEFISLVNEQSWQEDFLLSKQVFDLHEQGKIPGPGQCYALAPHPALCGPNPFNDDAIDPRFVTIMDMRTWQFLCAQFLNGQQ